MTVALPNQNAAPFGSKPEPLFYGQQLWTKLCSGKLRKGAEDKRGMTLSWEDTFSRSSQSDGRDKTSVLWELLV